MEKNEVFEKQAELKGWLQKLKLSQNEFAALFLQEIYDHSTDKEIERFQEKFKKELNRQSTKKEVIDKYIDFLYSLEKFKEAGYFRPQCNSDEILDRKAAKMMKELSESLSEKFESEDFDA